MHHQSCSSFGNVIGSIRIHVLWAWKYSFKLSLNTSNRVRIVRISYDNHRFLHSMTNKNSFSPLLSLCNNLLSSGIFNKRSNGRKWPSTSTSQNMANETHIISLGVESPYCSRWHQLIQKHNTIGHFHQAAILIQNASFGFRDLYKFSHCPINSYCCRIEVYFCMPSFFYFITISYTCKSKLAKIIGLNQLILIFLC